MSLREEWFSLSPRERDARVAEALGFHLYLCGSGRFNNPQRQAVAKEAPGPAWKLLPWASVWDGVPLPSYSSWEHAGPLLDKLREEGWRQIDIRWGAWKQDADAAPHRVHLYHPEVEEIHAVAETAPSAIALAFCLSREASA